MDAALPRIAEEQSEAELQTALACLTGINLDDLVASFGWQNRPLLANILRRLLRSPARTFARQILEFDSAVAEGGLVRAARQTLPNYVGDLHVMGGENVPSGPFIAVANHPGVSDALSLFAALNRPDLLVVALQRPFLQALPHTSRRLCCLSERSASHPAVLRRVGNHLLGGGAALSFPAGRIEPDPDMGGATESLDEWARSAGLFVRIAPDAAILPVLVRGVVWPQAMHRWLTPSKADTSKQAAALQLLAHVLLRLKPKQVTVQIGRPVYGGKPGTGKARISHQAVLAEMTELIRHRPGHK